MSNLSSSNNLQSLNLYGRPAKENLSIALQGLEDSSSEEKIWKAGVIALCGKEKLASSIIENTLESSSSLPENYKIAYRKWKGQSNGLSHWPISYFQLYHGIKPTKSALPPRKACIDWNSSSKENLIIKITCPQCKKQFPISAQSDFSQQDSIACLTCFQVVKYNKKAAVQTVREHFLNDFRNVEKVFAQRNPNANKLLVDIIAKAVLLENFTPVRFVKLRTDRIGHLCLNTEIMIQEHKYLFNKNNAIFICFTDQKICNKFMLEMWTRVLNFSPLAQVCFSFCKKSQALGELALDITTSNDPRNNRGKDLHGLLAKTPPTLEFTKVDHERAKPHLEKMGIPPGEPYVCFLGRDSAYLKKQIPDLDCSYHDYRNMPIHDYLPAMHALADMGIYCLRMGHIVEERLDGGRPEIIDYASNFRDEFMDVYLSANCEMFVSVSSGIDAIPVIFNKPVCYINLIPAGYIPWGIKYFCIHKKCRLSNGHNYLTYKEQLETGAAWFTRSVQYKHAGIDIVNNTQEEIKYAVLEAWKRAKGEWKDTPEEANLHDMMLSLFKKYDKFGYKAFNSRIGTEFLKANSYLLD
ncbi:TIGR04372 family glycosyltransferase [Desulfonatronovibrio magnus]|uniref:TIGR04372 family glycosyltransferase n=1 Tax=Desulfonatronovibrio magnus TaxID=698827 RepID=UPI000697D86A|nr:TIGR04372 family glycosyltransferase [Desulfonatronovibrio magnus]